MSTSQAIRETEEELSLIEPAVARLRGRDNEQARTAVLMHGVALSKQRFSLIRVLQQEATNEWTRFYVAHIELNASCEML